MIREYFRQTKVQIDPTGRFNIGESFKPKPEETTPTVATSETTLETTVVETDADKHCKICNISVTSVATMKTHLEGSKHAKKLKAIGRQYMKQF